MALTAFLSIYCDSLLSIPLFKKKIPKSMKRITLKYNLKLSKKMMKQSSNYDESLSNSFDSYYYGSISIGSSAQQFLIDFDTGSADLWLPGVKCDSDQVGCLNHNKYDSNLSSTYVPNGLAINNNIYK